MVEEKTTKNLKKFPPLSKSHKQQQSQKNLEPFNGKIMSLENDNSEAHKFYLAQKAQAYQMELEMILNSSKTNVLPGREYCENCDPRFKMLKTPKKTLNNLLL